MTKRAANPALLSLAVVPFVFSMANAQLVFLPQVRVVAPVWTPVPVAAVPAANPPVRFYVPAVPAVRPTTIERYYFTANGAKTSLDVPAHSAGKNENPAPPGPPRVIVREYFYFDEPAGASKVPETPKATGDKEERVPLPVPTPKEAIGEKAQVPGKPSATPSPDAKDSGAEKKSGPDRAGDPQA